jgi:hypothetical protein
MRIMALAGHLLSTKKAAFVRAADAGHEEARWVVRRWTGVEEKKEAWRKVFTESNTPLGLYLGGVCTDEVSVERLELLRESAARGNSWGQCAFARYYQYSYPGHVDRNVAQWHALLYLAAAQNNPQAFDELGDISEESPLGYYRQAAELGWDPAKGKLAMRYRQAGEMALGIRWGAQVEGGGFMSQLNDVNNGHFTKLPLKKKQYDTICYNLGWGLFWYQYGGDFGRGYDDSVRAFGETCLDYYCSCVELQQKSIFTFLLFWNQSVGVKDLGVMIGKMVWEEREENLVKNF